MINEDSAAYVKNWDEFRFIPGSIEAVSLLIQNGFRIILITNQSAVGRGILSLEMLDHIHRSMVEILQKSGGKIHDIFLCPHRPEDGCECRKPAPGMIRAAQQKHRIDPAASILIGDSAKDVECARRAGCGYAILVRTGHGSEAETELIQKGCIPDLICANLLAAAKHLISVNPLA